MDRIWRTDWLTDWLTPCSRLLLENLTVLQLVKFPAFYGTRRFITAFTSARHLPLSWARSVQSILPHPVFWMSILILTSHLRWSSCCILTSGLITKTLYASLMSPLRASCPVPLVLLNFITRMICSEEYRSFSFSLCGLLWRSKNTRGKYVSHTKF